MKFHFNRNLDYQREAIDAVVDIFKGQPISHSSFTVASLRGQIGLQETNLGVGNKLADGFNQDEIFNNVREIQLKNGLPQSEKMEKKQYHFTIEMETGTGKTYVYLRTLFELNQKYGFTKFIIVVPSVAVKEGVLQSIKMMDEHFRGLYHNVIYKAGAYQSKDIEGIREFATSDNIRIMVMTIHSFNKDTNIINNDHERTNGLKPLEFIRETNPIVIIDEPQSTVGTEKANDAVLSLNPLCTLRYSATHKEKHHLVYRLDAVDAYERQLVKQIEVSSVISKDDHNNEYLKLISVSNKKNKITAVIELDAKIKGKILRTTKTVKVGDDLFDLSGGREQYSGYIINEIYTAEGHEYVDFTSKDYIGLGEVRGGIDEDTIKQIQIKKTIEEHLDKELRLTKEGIKVLSLFFIDKVANYRYYDEGGNPQKGKFALWFEEAYKNIIKKPKYRPLIENKDIDIEAEVVHNGYFAIDRKGLVKDTTGNTQADEDIYNLIMKDKEKLISFESKLKFIFSHSALKEGWDNPNVFQICTLNETKSTMKKRQEIGRGLRLAVNQRGERIAGFDINTLTIMANESYEDFAKALQQEIEEDEGIKFGLVEKHAFANIVVATKESNVNYLQQEASEAIWKHLMKQDYIDKKGIVTDKLKQDLIKKEVVLPKAYEEVQGKIIEILKKIAGNLNIKNAHDKKRIKLNKNVFLSPQFKELWEKVKYKTTYSIDFDSERLIEACVEEIKKNLKIDRAKLIYTKGIIDINGGGTSTSEKDRHAMVVEEDYQLPDIITYLQNDTNLTRKTIVRILKGSDKLDDFKKNPQKFMDEVSIIIQRVMKHFIVDGIKYVKLGDEHYYGQELFQNQELTGYLSKNMMKSDRSVYEYILYDSDVEENFANKLENNNSIKVYAKLPRWFKIATPLGDYNPDWAVLVEKNGEEKLYFVIETKGSILTDELRLREVSKIKCGHKHFQALGNTVKFDAYDSFGKFAEEI